MLELQLRRASNSLDYKKPITLPRIQMQCLEQNGGWLREFEIKAGRHYVILSGKSLWSVGKD